ncbi:helix-turn-helix domain-containing protein [Marinifilum sp. RC60d5]|uniref:helix-turn-helix domain-containing protein n=1 Tax=Marinifilum sp. RC60d5 TaxID=3458414 RepID=UPI0040374BA5
MKVSSKESTSLHVNDLIIEEMNRQGVSAVELSKKLGINVNTVYQTLKRRSIHTDRLWKICEILQVNFFKILADKVNIENPVDEQLAILESENKTLKEVIKMLGGKG